MAFTITTATKNCLLFLLLCFFLLMGKKTMAQADMDSIRNVIETAPNDSVRIYALLDLGYEYEIQIPDSAIAIYQRAEALSARSENILGKAKALQYTGIVYHDKGEFYQSIRYYNKALYAYQQAQSVNGVATTYNNLGNTYLYLGDFEEAIRCYTLAQPFLVKDNRPEQLVVITGNLGDCYRQLKDYPSMLNMARLSYGYAQQLNDRTELANASITLGTALSLNGKNDSAFYYLNSALQTAKELNDPALKYYAEMDLTTIDRDKGNFIGALNRADSVMQAAQLLQINYLTVAAHNLRGDCLMNLGKMEESKSAFEQALQLAKKDGALKLQQEAVDRLYQWYNKKGDLANALAYRNEWIALNDSLFSQEKSKQIALIRTIYETEEKEKMIEEERAMNIEKDAKIKVRNAYLIGAVALLVVVAAVSWSLINRQKNKRKIAEQEALLQAERSRILEKEKDVVQMRSLIEGQEQERHRLGRDLHDGLGGMLSAARMQLGQLKELQSDNTTMDQWNNLDTLIATSAREMRTISHNLAPEGLDKLGLSASIQSFCQRVSTDELTIEFDLHGEPWKSSMANDIAVYRLIQELVNNTLKHAKAKSCFVSMSYMDDSLLITVEDDGIGMKLSETQASKGMSNLNARISFLNGKFDIISAPGNGCSINLTIPRYD